MVIVQTTQSKVVNIVGIQMKVGKIENINGGIYITGNTKRMIGMYLHMSYKIKKSWMVDVLMI